DTLRTLPEREFRSGLAEVIKYGIIYDARLFATLERGLDRVLRLEEKSLIPMIARCCEIKGAVVSQDETETGLRAILNFGHTVGHAIENSFGYGKFLHGEAISMGQIVAARLSERLMGLPRPEVERIKTLFHRAGLPIGVRLNTARRRKLFDAMRLDKKTSGGQVRFVLARRIGEVEFGIRVPDEAIDWALRG
ncbi:MAG: 3-dehydroquinate synthase, partial [Limisphaerales bacterium]